MQVILANLSVKFSRNTKARKIMAIKIIRKPSKVFIIECQTCEALLEYSFNDISEGISNGSIKEQGSHDELVESNGIYANLYSLQFRTGDTTYLSHELKDGDY
jgi:hypothetical protein